MSMAIKYAMKKRAKSKQEETSQHVPVTEHDADSFGGKSYAVEHTSGSKKMFHADEGSHEDVKRQAEEYRSRNLAKMAKGGDIHGDMVDRIMQKRCYSEGGMVANGGDDDLDQMADGDPNNFDDLALRDHLEEHYTGKNSGDELGNEQEDQDRHDIVARIMHSRAKKDRNPRPA